MVEGVEVATEAEEAHSLAGSLEASSPKFTAHDCPVAAVAPAVLPRGVSKGDRRLSHRDEDDVAVCSARMCC